MKHPSVAILLTLLVGCSDSNDDEHPPVIDMGSKGPPWGSGDTGSNDSSTPGGAGSDPDGSRATGGTSSTSSGGASSSGGSSPAGGAFSVSSGGATSSGGAATPDGAAFIGGSTSDF